MCVFLSLRMDKAKIEKHFDAGFDAEESFRPRYVQSAFEFERWPVISSEQSSGITLMNWGLIPGWVKDEERAKKIKTGTVNARIESVNEKPSFRPVINKKRCLILAEGFFEYRELNKKKFPYYIQLKRGYPFAIAGIYDDWVNNVTGEIVRSFALLTTRANSLMEVIHNRKKRMPVILPRDKESKWLEMTIDPEDIETPIDGQGMEAWPVSRLISSRNQSRNTAEVLKIYNYPELVMMDKMNFE